MSAKLATVRIAKPELSERREQIDKPEIANWLNRDWKYVNIHNHTLENFRERLEVWKRIYAKEKKHA